MTLSCRFLVESLFLDQWLHELSPNDLMPVFSYSTLSKNAARVRHLRMRATLPLYTFAARAQNRVEVDSELMTTRKRVGGTRAR